jgi:Domain of unknown function (DUF929)
MASSDRKPSARDRAAAARAQQMDADKRRQRARVALIIIVGVVVIAAVALWGLSHASKDSVAFTPGPVPTSVINAVANVPQTTLNTVGVGTSSNDPKAGDSSVTMTADGKPRVLYVGGEFCPYCAGQRWAVTQALSRFGTFSVLQTGRSNADDLYLDTFSYHGASYASSTLAFTGAEIFDRNGKALDTLSAADNKLYQDAPGIPYVNIGGKYIVSGASFDVTVLKGLDWTQISTQMQDPTTAVAKAVDGAANVLTAAICGVTDNAPASVCNTPAVQAGAAKLPSGS